MRVGQTQGGVTVALIRECQIDKSLVEPGFVSESRVVFLNRLCEEWELGSGERGRWWLPWTRWSCLRTGITTVQ